MSVTKLLTVRTYDKTVMATKAELTALFADVNYQRDIIARFPDDGFERVKYMEKNKPATIIDVFGISPMAQFKADPHMVGRGEYLYFIQTFVEAVQTAFSFSQNVAEAFKQSERPAPFANILQSDG